MKTVYIVSEYIFNTTKTKVKKYRFVQSLFGKVAEKEIKTEKIQRIDYHKWFNTIVEAEQHLKTLS